MPNNRSYSQFSPAFEAYKTHILSLLKVFNEQGHILLNTRNTIKSFDTDSIAVNIKSFRPPHLVNKIVYRHFRKSKARRSFEHASLLMANGFGTPAPIAFIEEYDALGLTHSYYISSQVQNTFVMTDVIHTPDFPDKEKLIVLYTRFHFNLHEAGIEFLDNTQGNTLFEKKDGEYSLYLVDLNRMHTGKKMNIEKRILNFARLTRDVPIMKIIAGEYARLSGYPVDKLEPLLLNGSLKMFGKLDRKKKWKRKWKALKSKGS